MNLRWGLPFDDGIQILPLSHHDLLPQRLDPDGGVALVSDRLVPERVDSEEIRESEQALVAEGIVRGSVALRDAAVAQEQVRPGTHIDGLQFGVEVLHEPVEGDVIAVVLQPHDLPHLLEQREGRVVELHEVPAHEGDAHQPHREHHLLLPPPVLEPLPLQVLEVAHLVGDDRPHAAHRVRLPHLEPPLQLLTVQHHVVINDEKDLCSALRGDLVAPVHGVVGRFKEIDGAFPGGPVEADMCLFRLDFVVPDDVELSSEGAVHGCVALDVALDHAVPLPAGVRYRDEGKTEQQMAHLAGTFNPASLAVQSSAASRNARRGKALNCILFERQQSYSSQLPPPHLPPPFPSLRRHYAWRSDGAGPYCKGGYIGWQHLIIVLLVIMLVDPRPYTYEYRKPRYSNPTFQSRNLYDSLYHRNSQRNDYFPDADARTLNRNFSEVKSKSNNFDHSPRNDRNPERYDAGFKLPALAHNERAGVPSNLGSLNPSSSRPEVSQRKEGFERFRIYQRQQQPYNIISCYPKEDDNNQLRSFPKLTLENRLLERGSYHSFKEDKF